MPLDPAQIEKYPAGVAINRQNLDMCEGCDSVLTTTTIYADGTIGACCGIGSRLIPELQMGPFGETTLAEAARIAESDFLKRWIRSEGPERILAWAAQHDPDIEWENMYAHRCQACLRIYQDQRVRQTIREYHSEKIPDVLIGEWLLFGYAGAQPDHNTKSEAPKADDGPINNSHDQ
jgi:hypothetical protein